MPPAEHLLPLPAGGTATPWPVLAGLTSKILDFLYFTGNSGEIRAVLIEIEAPNKLWFTNKGTPTATITQASHKLAQWKAWFSDPTNAQQFERDYRVGRAESADGRSGVLEFGLGESFRLDRWMGTRCPNRAADCSTCTQ